MEEAKQVGINCKTNPIIGMPRRCEERTRSLTRRAISELAKVRHH